MHYLIRMRVVITDSYGCLPKSFRKTCENFAIGMQTSPNRGHTRGKEDLT